MSAGVLNSQDSRTLSSGDGARAAIAIVEDNAGLGSILRRIVDSTPECRCAAVWRSGEEALAQSSVIRPDVVLMDIQLPGISGIETTARLKAESPELLVVMATVYNDHDKIFDALKAGACGYVLKRSSPAEVRRAIQEVREGGAPMSPEIARRVAEAFLLPSRQTGPSLSESEANILERLGQGWGSREIADQLGLDGEAVRGRLKRIYEKLHLRSGAGANPPQLRG